MNNRKGLFMYGMKHNNHLDYIEEKVRNNKRVPPNGDLNCNFFKRELNQVRENGKIAIHRQIDHPTMKLVRLHETAIPDD